MVKLIGYALFAVSVLEKVFPGITRDEAAKSPVLALLYNWVRPNLELVFVLGCAWLFHCGLRVLVFRGQ